MASIAVRLLYALTMIILIVVIDILFLRHHIVARLIVNVAIVAVFATIYLLSFRRR